MFHRLEIRSKATNVAEIKKKLIEEVSRHLRSLAKGQSDLGKFVVQLQMGTSRLGMVKPFY